MKLCECGCGQPTSLAKQTDRRSGAKVGQPMRFIHGHFQPKLSGANHPSWKGGTTRMSDGYRLVLQPHHPRAYRGGYVLEHVLVASAALGRPLPKGPVVHHVDDDTSNNKNSNLAVLQDNGEHKTLHRRRTILRAGGNPWTQRLCCTCHQAKDFSEFYQGEKGGECRECAKTMVRERKRRRAG